MIFQSYVIIIFSVFSSFPSDCETNFFLADDNVNSLVHNYRCVTNSSFALSWNDVEDLQDNLQQVSNYIPPLPETAFNCNIEDDTKTKDFFLKPPWSLKESLNSKINQIILDRRWEDMAVVTTKASRGLDNFYEPVLSNLKNNFKIPMSIRGESEAHLFLCDGADPTSSNCYWFMLQAFSGTQSAIRKCEKGYIPLRRNAYPKGSCQAKLTSIYHPNFPTYLSKQYWSHFKLEKKNNILSLTKINGNKMNMEILKLIDKGSVINATHMIVHSKKLNTLWKIHQTSFIYTDKERSELTLGPLLDSIEDTICISMFISMCQNCKLKLALTKNNQINKEEVYKVESMEWLEIKFLVENIKGDKFSLLVSTIGGTSDRFWAIDKVRQCQKHEFRLIGFNGFNKSPLCQLMDADKNVIPNTRKFFTPSDISCSEDTIGEFCVPCRWIYANCEKIITCSKKQASGEATCTCSAGFQSYNNCFFKCNPGYYGHGCLKKCGKCLNQCNPIDGSCAFCTSSYTGPKCNIPPFIIFKNAPKIISVRYTEATVQVTDFEVQDVIDNEMNLFYSIEFTADGDATQNWFSVDKIQKFYDSKVIKMENLKPDTSYSVRSIVIIKDKNITYHNDFIPVSAFTTKCQDIVQNIYIKASNTTVNISIKSGTTKAPCKLNKYIVTILDGVYPMLANENYIHFEKLVPYSNYTVMIHRGSNVYQKSFQTTEGIPELVQNLTISNVSASTIRIQWQKPHVIFGKLENYVLELQHLYFVACKSQQFKSKDNKKVLKVNRTSVTIDELIPFSKYSLSVFAVNTKFEGKRQIVEFTTQHLEMIQLEEFPQITDVLSESESVRVKLSIVNCTKIRGPIFIPATLTCTNEWCKNYTTTNFVKDFQLSFTQLYPFSNYTLTLSFCRSSTLCNTFTRHLDFKTKPSAPSMVKNLTVFSKSKNSISLRWMPPYPSTGILRSYRIESLKSSDLKTQEIVSAKNSTCKLWPKFHCATLTNLQENKKYEIFVSARNDIPTSFGSPNSIIAVTRTEPSEAPYDLNLFWSRNNDLVLNWKHPNQSNGAIKYFNISIIPKSSKIEKIGKQIFVDDNTYSLIYYYKIGAKDLAPSTSYMITISAYNDHFGKELKTTVISPPDIPSLSEDPQISSTNHTITLQLSTKEPKGLYNYSLILLVSDQSNESIKFSELGNLQIQNFRIVSKCNVKNFSQPIRITIGDGKQLQNCDPTIKNPSLDPGDHYNITLFLINSFQGKTRFKNVSLCINTGGKSMKLTKSDFNFLYLLVLLLILPIGICLYVLRNKWGETKKSEKTTEIPLVMSKTRQSIRSIQNNRNTMSKVFSKAVPLGHFEEYMNKCKTNGELERQHSMVFNYPVRSIYEATDGGLFFDYVDMEFADGTNIPKAYIAADIPKTSCIDDFWKILWEENVQHIILLADSQIKKYWPEINEKKTCHDITVQLAFANKLDHYFYRKFILFRHDQIKQVEQIHFQYCGLNPQKFVPLFSKTLKLSLETASPVLFHSNNLRETGLVLMCDMSLRIAKEERVIDVLKILNKLSCHTSNYVDNVEQYKLAHFIIWEYVFGDCQTQTTDYVNF